MRKLAQERSKDGKLVTDAQAQGHWIRGTAQGNGLIVGSGDYGPVVAFDPKTNEAIVTKMAGQDTKNPGPKRVAFGNGVFVVVGEQGLIARTKDGKTWENNRTRDDVGDVQCVEFNGKEFLLTRPMRSRRDQGDEVHGWPDVGNDRLARAAPGAPGQRRTL